MQKIINLVDEVGGIETDNPFARWLDRIAFIFLVLMVLSAPHSIAATQIAWLLGMLAWVIRLFVKPRPKIVRTPLDIALWAFFGWTVITSIFSYAPDISLGKLRGAALFLIFYFVVNNLWHLRAVKFLALALIFSSMVSAIWSPIERIIGRGVEISGIKAESLFTKADFFDHDIYLKARNSKPKTIDDLRAKVKKGEVAFLIEGDAIIEANGNSIRTPDELLTEIEKNEVTFLECFRTPNYFTIIVKRENLFDGTNSLEKVGISDWKRGRNWRYAGFYGQIITYAEVLQLITSLVFGLFIASISKPEIFQRKRENYNHNPKTNPQLILIVCLVAMIIALSLTFTRAAQLALLVSAVSVVFANGNRKLTLTFLAVILPLALVGLFFLQQNRQVGFYDTKDDSITYRQTIYREGFNLWMSSPRRFFLGVGMDSTKRYAEDWQLFDNGKLPKGHFHSTPLQLLVERGLPAFLLWLWILWIYAKTLWRGIKVSGFRFQVSASETENKNPKSQIPNPKSDDWQTSGIILGCFGGLIGFFTSSLVNYSLGDSEVAMVFYLLMGFGFYCANHKFQILKLQTTE